jgi:hypothetical protein
MITVDTLLIELFRQGIETLHPQIPARDKKVLISLARQINSGHFLTENQSKLLVKIFKENSNHIFDPLSENLTAIETPTWSHSFRVLDQVRKIFLAKEHEGRILVEFTYNKRLRQQITELNKTIEGQMLSINNRQYSVPLTEKNLHQVVNAFKPQGFSIDPLVMKFYEEISEIYEKSSNQFDVFNLSNEKIINLINHDIGGISEDNLILLNDRRLKFQYSVFPKNPEKSLKNSLANRPSSRVWVDSNITSLDDLVMALYELNRLPVLFVFNGHDSKECLQNLKKMEKSLKNCDLNKVGIYFRFDSAGDSNKDFNASISHLGYNVKLDKQTLVAGIANNKLPKFMLKNGWYPNSVISFSNNFKSNKTSVYCDAVDLIVYYNDKRPLGGVDAIV